MDYLNFINTETQATGNRSDVTPLFSNAEVFASAVHELAQRFADTNFEYVAGIDALGFILGAALAFHTQKGFIPIRKGGKLPVLVERAEFVDYTGQKKSLEVSIGAIAKGTKVLLVDEWVETGAQVKAAIQLIEQQGGVVVGIAALNIDYNANTQPVYAKYNCQSLISNS